MLYCCFVKPSDRIYITLGPMEFFLLALIGRMELKSLYDLRQKAALEPGAIRLTLRRLEADELITRSERGRRMRRDLAVTPAGFEALQRWHHSLQSHGDAESVLRVAFVAWTMAGPQEAMRYLSGVAYDRRGRGEEKKMEATYLERAGTDPLSAYLWMRSTTEGQRLSAEGEAFLNISRTIEGGVLSRKPERE